MKTVATVLCLFFLVCINPSVQADVGTSLLKVNQALVMIEKVKSVSDKYQQLFGDESDINVDEYLEVSEPLNDSSGKYVLPYDSAMTRTEWAEKAITAQAAAAVGGEVADKATDAIASKIPFGGLASGLFKDKGKSLAAVTAIGGWDFIKSSSDLSFEELDEYAVYLHHTYSGEGDYSESLAAAMAIYPELEKAYPKALDKAYKKASKEAKKAAKNK